MNPEVLAGVVDRMRELEDGSLRLRVGTVVTASPLVVQVGGVTLTGVRQVGTVASADKVAVLQGRNDMLVLGTPTGGGGGIPGDVAALEAAIAALEVDVAAVETDVAAIETELGSNPSGLSATVAAKLGGLIINVKTDYGAAGNGSADDTAEIQAAIDAAATAGGGIVYIPATTLFYRISQLRMKTNVWLMGAGFGSQLRSISSNPNAYCIVLDATTVRQAWVTDLSLFCVAANQTTNGGILYDHTGEGVAVMGHHFERLYVFGFKNDAMHFAGPCREIWIQNCQIIGNNGNGIVLETDATDSYFTNIDIGTSGLAGFVCDAASNRLTSVKSYRSGQITAASGVGFLITENQIEMANCEAQSNLGHGFYFNDSDFSQAIGCYSDSNQDDAFRLNNCSDTVLQGVAHGVAATTPKHDNIVNFQGTCTRNNVDVVYSAAALAGGGAAVVNSSSSSSVDVRLVGATTSAYTVTNPTTDRALDVTGNTTAQGLAVLGTLITDLQSRGVIG